MLAHLDRLDDPVRAVERLGLFQLEGRGHRYRWQTIARLEDAGLITAEDYAGGYILRFTAAGRELLGA